MPLSLFRLKEVEGLDLDDPSSTTLHREILLNKPFLKSLYEDWYGQFVCHTPDTTGQKLELGSGGGFLKEVIPDVITSDILELPYVDRVFSAEKLPFGDESLRAVYLLNTLHHIPNPLSLLSELERCLAPGGRLICIEPAHTLLSRFMYTHIHHEPFEPEAGYFLQPGKPLSNSNQALPWILFARDWDSLKQEFPGLRLVLVKNHTPFRFILSGGFSFKAFLPQVIYPVVKAIEQSLPTSVQNLLGLFMTIVVEKASADEAN